MKQNAHQNPQNNSSGQDLSLLSASELSEKLEKALSEMTEETYDEALIDSYIHALEQKNPFPEFPDASEAYSKFKQLLSDDPQEPTSKTTRRKSNLHPISLRVALVAALSIAVLMGTMILAQAVGVDVFGAMARWTDEVFSFGPVSEQQLPQINAVFAENSSWGNQDPFSYPEKIDYASLQDALDYHHITEVSAPTWLPKSCDLMEISCLSNNSSKNISIFSTYEYSDQPLTFDIRTRTNASFSIVEKTDAPVESTVIHQVPCYVIQNTQNYTVAWLTDHYECYLSGPEKNVLIQIARSILQ